MQERLQKFIARSSAYSRRKAEELIQDGKVTVNGVISSKLGTTIDPDVDQVAVLGEVMRTPTEFTYCIVNKPVGYVCTRAKIRGEHSVYELVPKSSELLIAGRLDEDSEGLVLLTNDGALVQELTHPSFTHEKEYEVSTKRPFLDADFNQLKRGVRMKEGVGKADKVERVNSNTIRITLHQGWNRQIRRMMGTLKHEVKRLKRIRISKLELGDLELGKWREVGREAITD